MKLTTLAIVLAILPLTACSIIGQSESSCPGKPGGYVCKGPREVYELTNNKNSLFDGTQEGLDEDDDEKKPDATKDVDGIGAQVATPSSAIPSNSEVTTIKADSWAAPEPLAVRSDARVLRIQFAAYEDDTGALNMPGYAYVEVEPRRWIVGSGADSRPARIVPLVVRQDADKNLKGKVSKTLTVDPLGVQHTIPQPGAASLKK